MILQAFQVIHLGAVASRRSGTSHPLAISKSLPRVCLNAHSAQVPTQLVQTSISLCDLVLANSDQKNLLSDLLWRLQ